jgi:hypothetical protein
MVLYRAGREGGAVFLYDLETGTERKVYDLPKAYAMMADGVIGPHSEYVRIHGDFNGDGLAGWALKSIWADELPRVLWTSPTGDVWHDSAPQASVRMRGRGCASLLIGWAVLCQNFDAGSQAPDRVSCRYERSVFQTSSQDIF